ncbi:MAG: hypothetical protein HC788_09565 [Sphingopyxis sp.]|nr:hypothetical protein [Sphingopyxis sp.]
MGHFEGPDRLVEVVGAQVNIGGDGPDAEVIGDELGSEFDLLEGDVVLLELAALGGVPGPGRPPLGAGAQSRW